MDSHLHFQINQNTLNYTKVITEKSNVLLKFLHKNFSKDKDKDVTKKESGGSNKRENRYEAHSSRKRIRIERID